MGRCISCGRNFDGLFTCPACVAAEKRTKQQTEAIEEAIEQAEEETREANRREQEANRQAIEEAASRMEEATAEAAERFIQAKAESWMLEAQSKSDRAFDLYEGGMHEEAVNLAREAIKQDPNNIEPYMCAAWALRACGSHVNARWYYQKQIELLRTSENRESADRTRQVLEGLPDDMELRAKLLAVLHENSARWSISTDTMHLLNELIQKDLLVDARFLMEVLFSKSPKIPRRTDLLALQDELLLLCDKLVKRDRLGDARFLMEFLTTATDWLLPRAYLIEIGVCLGETTNGPLTDFLKRISFDRRQTIVKDLDTMLTGRYRFSASCIIEVQKSVRARYEQWMPDIVRERNVAALEAANSNARIKAYCRTASLMTPGGLGVLIWFGGWLGLGLAAAGLAAAGLEVGFAEADILSCVGGILFGWIASRVRRGRAARMIVKTEVENSEHRELSVWAPFVGLSPPTVDLSSPPAATRVPQTSGKAIASLVCGLLFLGGLGAIVAVAMGHWSRSEIRKSGGRLKGMGMATAGLIFGYVWISIILILILFQFVGPRQR